MSLCGTSHFIREGQERVAGKPTEVLCLGPTAGGEGGAGGAPVKLTCKSQIFSPVNENSVPRESVVVTNLGGV